MTSSENLVSAKLDLIFNNVSKVFVIFGCLLFFSITLGVSLSYRTDVVSVIIGYHLCFLILAVGLAIRYAYNPGKMLPDFPVKASIRPLKESLDKIKTSFLLLTCIGISLLLISVWQTGGAIFMKINGFSSYDSNGKRMAFGIIHFLTGSSVLLLLCCRKRILILVVGVLGFVSFVCGIVLLASYLDFTYYLQRNEKFHVFGYGNEDQLPFPNPIILLMGTSVFIPQQLVVPITGFITLFTIDLIIKLSKDSNNYETKSKESCRNKLFLILSLFSIFLTIGLSISSTLLYLMLSFSKIGFYGNYYLNLSNTFVIIALLLGITLLILSKRNPSLILKTFALAVSVAVLSVSIWSFVVLALKVSEHSTTIKGQSQDLCVTLQSDSCWRTWNRDPNPTKLCIPSTKICDGYLDLMRNANGTINQLCSQYDSEKMALEDESECLMDRFSGIIYFNFVGLSAFVLLSFTVISLLCKEVFVGHYRNLKWVINMFRKDDKELDDKRGEANSALLDKESSTQCLAE